MLRERYAHVVLSGRKEITDLALNESFRPDAAGAAGGAGVGAGARRPAGFAASAASRSTTSVGTPRSAAFSSTGASASFVRTTANSAPPGAMSAMCMRFRPRLLAMPAIRVMTETPRASTKVVAIRSSKICTNMCICRDSVG
jgi:hypothetical protein